MAHIRSFPETQSSKNIFYISLAYYIILIAYCIDRIIDYRYYCYSDRVASSATIASMYLYNTQAVVLGFILFRRLVTIFEGSAYELSRATVLVSAAIIVFDGSLANISYSLYKFGAPGHAVWIALLGLAALLALIIIIALNFVFIYKLYVVHSASGAAAKNDRTLLLVITKTTILCFMSTGITLFSMLFYICWIATQAVALEYIYALFVYGDILTNFLCVVLAARQFDAWYFLLCNCCHERLASCCNLHAKRNNTIKEMLSTQTSMQQHVSEENHV
eukprot:CAMPEP_0197057488 /NCGR_PEP_ID=MMETSP1384-20130603/97719_1 /TAXON_ID=29189 /ORGANISM="Ammonia sp." /LENGTH=275 /DNA_ID=CAMNT_0042491933 /DNA_START=63 /DNA_END=890 /DNA_ORIENTATION=+